MKKIVKAIGITAGMVTAATACVAVKNAAEVTTDEKSGHTQTVYEKYVKRPLDFFCAASATVALSPVLAATAVIVRFNLGSPVLFTQERPGKDGKIFKLYKFRSMSEARDSEGNYLPDKVRLNKFGRILRSTSVDELPELFNILKGDMSIVGPRPLLVSYLEQYNSHDSRRHEVRPGLTGLAQVSGRNALTWKEKFEKDIEYVDNMTFLLDAKVVLLTIKKVFMREGIEFKEEHQPIVEYFKLQKKEGSI